jgi:poly(A) polymerase
MGGGKKGEDKVRFPMAQEIYNRVRWDPGLDAAAFVIGWAARDGRTQETALLAWKDGEVPWHRARYIKAGGEVVWDREARIDLVSSGQVSGQDALAVGSVWDTRIGAWAPGAPAPKGSAGTLTVATWNVLAGRFAPKLAREDDARVSGIADAVAELGADVVALQEVDRETLEALCAHEGLRAGYAFTHEPADADDVARHGMLVLSRHAMRWREREFGPTKSALVVDVRAGSKTVRVIAVHLTSDRASGAEEKRRGQLEAAMELAQEREEVVLLGDFNAAGDELSGLVEGARFADVWARLRPDEPGYTFIPRVNRLANLTTVSGAQRRLDRVLWRSSGGALSPGMVEVRGQGLEALSDHEPVVAVFDLERRACQVASGDHGAALAWVLRDDEVGAIAGLRAEYDAAARRWPAHVTLLHPFVGREHHAEAAALLAHAWADVDASSVVLSGAGSFEQAKGSVAWVGVEDDGALATLRERARALFRGVEAREDHTPHLTVGRGAGASAALRAASRLEPREADLYELALLARGEDGVFEVTRRVELGGAGVLDAALRARGAGRDGSSDALVGRLEAELGALEEVGSRAIGAALPWSDLDLFAPSEDPEADLKRARKAAGRVEGVEVVRVVEGANPTLRLLADGRRVDVLFGGRGSRDAGAVAAALERGPAGHGALEAWREVTRYMKHWARSRGLYGGAFGLWGGAAWAAVCAWGVGEVARQARRVTGVEVARALFARLAEWSWPEPVSLTGAPAPRASGPMPVLNPADDGEDLARGMTRACAVALQLELMLAQERLSQGEALSALLEPSRAEGSRVEITLATGSGAEADLARLEGWFLGRLAHLLHHLDGFDPRPHTVPTRRAGALTYALEVHPRSMARRAAQRVEELLPAPEEPGDRVEVEVRG